MPSLTLGLDLGPNSIGWALVDEAGEEIVATGVRVFPEGVDKFDTKKEASKKESRRVARGMRRQIARRARRKRKLRDTLIEVGLYPSDAAQQQALENLDPYLLRSRGLDEPLEPAEFGRVLLHLNQRRGFLSNRKSDRERKAETKGMLAEINELAGEIVKSGSRTLGEHLAQLRDNPHHRVRKRHTRRDMYLEEFEALYTAQQKHHPQLLTDDLKQQIHRRIFFQRSMYWPKSVVGRCDLEPKRRRCPRADRLAQRFRLLQEVNNLRYIEPATGDEHPLSQQHRQLLLEKLSTRKEMTFVQIRKALGFLESVHFNLERGKRTKLKGMITDALLAHKDIFGSAWHDRPEMEKTEIVYCLVHRKEAKVQELATTQWGLSEAATDKLLDVDLPSGYLHLSQAALEKLVPPMERGLLYMTDDNTPSALSEAGYLRPDQIRASTLDQLPEPPEITNPVVRQALFEVRKVVNAILREYGKPAKIHVELARNAKASGEERKKINDAMRQREEQRDEAATKIREHGVRVNRQAIDRYLLWQEQARLCVYSGESISVTQLLGGEIDIDHILPYSRCLDDSFANKVVCFRKANADKGNQTPYEWLAKSDPDGYELMRQRIAHLPYNKRRRFTQKELVLDDFISRQLNDTRYISRSVLEYVRKLYEHPHDVLCIKGQQTATLRRHWGLNSVLRRDDEDIKNRDDHRHHAVDAMVIALTNQSRLQKLAALARKGPEEETGELMLDPWTNFREDVEKAVNQIHVSHRVQRKVSGALHEETLYGPTKTTGEYVVRKPLDSLTLAMIDDIRDQTIRDLVIARLKSYGIEHGRGKKGKITKEVWKEPLLMLSGVEVKKVRLIKRDLTIQPIRDGSSCVKPGSTHHLCLFEWDEKGKAKRDAVFVTMLEAINRIKNKQPVIQRTHHEKPEARFVMSLSGNETVLLEHNGQESLFRFDTAAATSKQMWFRKHHAGGKSSEKIGVISKNPNTLIARKVTVDPLGRVRWAND